MLIVREIFGVFLCHLGASPGTDRFSRNVGKKLLPYAALYVRGRDSSVGIATRYGLDGPGIESRLRARFSAPAQTCPGAQPASCTMGTGFFSGVKRPRRGADYPSPSSAEVEGSVELYICSPSGPSWPVIG